MSKMTHKGYQAVVEYDADDGIFVGHILGIRDTVGFHADNVPDLQASFQEAVDDYLETCACVGKEPDRFYSGKMMLRVDPDIHRRAAIAAEAQGKSLNQWSEDVLRQAAG